MNFLKDGTIERSDVEIEMGMEIIRKGLSEIPDRGKDLERQLNISILEFIRLAYGCVQMHSENTFGKERLRSQSAVKIQLDAIKTYLDNE